VSDPLSDTRIKFYLMLVFMQGTAYIPINIFDEFIFKPERVNPENDHLTASQMSDTPDSVVFEVPLDALLECLNIFGSGTPVGGGSISGNKPRWRSGAVSDDEGRGRAGGGGRTVDLNVESNTNGRLDHYFHPTAELRKTGMRMGYGGRGYPLSFLL
jgi:cell cycle checkpoint protein